MALLKILQTIRENVNLYLLQFADDALWIPVAGTVAILWNEPLNRYPKVTGQLVDQQGCLQELVIVHPLAICMETSVVPDPFSCWLNNLLIYRPVWRKYTKRKKAIKQRKSFLIGEIHIVFKETEGTSSVRVLSCSIAFWGSVFLP